MMREKIGKFRGFTFTKMKTIPSSQRIHLRFATLFAACILSATAARAQYHVFYSFTGGNGVYPEGGLTLNDGFLYGTTGSTIFRYDLHPPTFIQPPRFQTIHTFATPEIGLYPTSALLTIGQTLYGTLSEGGIDNGGSVFKINTDGTSAAAVHLFNPANEWSPAADLTLSGGTLYGSASYSGTNGLGVFFKIRPDGTGYQVLRTLSNIAGNDSRLVVNGDTIYGIDEGRALTFPFRHYGFIFSMKTDGSDYTVLRQFTIAADGLGPRALTFDGNTLYGTCLAGGAANAGTVFSMNTDGSGFQTLKSFVSSEGSRPTGELTLSGGTLYGVTSNGGAFDAGVLYSIDTDGSDFRVFEDFGGLNGERPLGGVVVNGDDLFGVTTLGGTNGYGTLYVHHVPEPAIGALLLFGGLALSRRTRRS